MDNTSFSRWTQWSDRDGLDEGNGKGVYILACFESQPPVTVDSAAREIIMIAAVRKRPLIKRWEELDQAARSGQSHHSEGRRFHQLYMKGKTAIPSWLYVSAALADGNPMGTRKG